MITSPSICHTCLPDIYLPDILVPNTAVFLVCQNPMHRRPSRWKQILPKPFDLSGGMTSFNHVQPIYAQLLKISWVTSPLIGAATDLLLKKGHRQRWVIRSVPVINSPWGQTGVRNPLLTQKDCEMQIMIQLMSPSTWMCGPHKSDPWCIIHVPVYIYISPL